MSGNAVHVRIEGRVQGVWYRGWTERAAMELGLSGWVRNRRDGPVEAVFAGASSNIDKMVKKCYEGPPSARVTEVITEPTTEDVQPGFKQVATL